jgi:DNA-binding transcriptional LysR family regulator
MLAWDHLRFALALARHGTLARAAEALGLGLAEAPARFRAMEEEAGATLFLRTGSRLEPTDAGRRLLRAAERMAEEMSRVDRALPPLPVERVRVRVSVDAALAALWLRASGAALLPALGAVELELTSQHEAELSVGWIRPTRAGWSGRRLGALGFGLYGSGEYLADHGRPRTAAALAGHRWVLGSEAGEPSAAGRWAGRAAAAGGTVALRTDHPALFLAAVASGLGLGVLSQGAEDADPALVRLFPISELRPRALWLGRPRDTRSAPHIGRAAKALDATLGEVVRRWQHRG